MKIYLGLIAAAALAMTACSKEEAKPAETSAPAASATSEVAAPAEASAAVSAPAAENASATASTAGECAAVVESNDQMQYDLKEIDVKSSCKEFTITLKNKGTAPKASMGHNIVISKAADKADVLKDGSSAGEAADYVKADDSRVLAHTKLLGGGEEDSLKLDVSKLEKGADYEFYCTFPGHAGLMDGQLKLVD